MKPTIGVTYMDKSSWGDGAWQQEPDRLQWTDHWTGFDCLVNRNFVGALCGYVAVPTGHYHHGVRYDQCGKSASLIRELAHLIGTMRVPMVTAEVLIGALKEGCYDNESQWYCNHRPDCTYQVPGGITFAGRAELVGAGETGVGFITNDEGNAAWLLGFDCAHGYDYSPNMYVGFKGEITSYKDIEFVKAHVRGLASQIKDFKSQS